MLLTKFFFLWNFNSIITSKIIVKNFKHIPKIKKVSLFFIINAKQYKKNLLLFYIIINLIFGNILLLKNKSIKELYIFKLKLKRKKILPFVLHFVNIYLPLINISEKLIKKNRILFNLKNQILLYRLNYFSFPLIPELDFFYTKNEQIYHFINEYRFQLDIYIKSFFYMKNSFEFLFRMYRFPFNFKFIKKID